MDFFSRFQGLYASSSSASLFRLTFYTRLTIVVWLCPDCFITSRIAGLYYYVNWIEDLCKKRFLAYIFALRVFMVNFFFLIRIVIKPVQFSQKGFIIEKRLFGTRETPFLIKAYSRPSWKCYCWCFDDFQHMKKIFKYQRQGWKLVAQWVAKFRHFVNFNDFNDNKNLKL